MLIIDERYPPSKWPLARVVDGNDGLARVATLRTAAGSTLRRPVTKLCLLPVAEQPGNYSRSEGARGEPPCGEGALSEGPIGELPSGEGAPSESPIRERPPSESVIGEGSGEGASRRNPIGEGSLR